MILTRLMDNLTGRGETAVTVPPLDGALRPNRALDEAPVRLKLAEADCLAVIDGALHASSGRALYRLDGDDWTVVRTCEAGITCVASLGEDAIAVALTSGRVVLHGGALEGREFATDAACITAMCATGTTLYLANGSATNAPADWQRDLIERNRSGALWRIELTTGETTRIATDLAWPAGLVATEGALVVSEAWAHRLIRLDPATPRQRETLYPDLAGYPGRITKAADGYWLAVFAPRSQLVEFVLREPRYRRQMLSSIDREHWIAPRLRSGGSFYEPLQGGGVKQLGRLKPWAPTFSAGLCIRLDDDFQPISSLHSRADGETHGVTSVLEHAGQVYAAARGDGTVIALPAEETRP